jgi:hypothetical protein
MKPLLILCGILLVTLSCKKTITYGVQITITNRADSLLQVTLFPKAEFLKGDLYKSSSMGSGYSETQYSLQNYVPKGLYYTDDLDITPNQLLNSVFDSIWIKISLDSVVTIKFCPENAINYKENMYSGSSNWRYSEGRIKMGLSSETVVHTYDFEIYLDKIGE